MKIIILTAFLKPYGGERVAIDLAHSFSAAGHDVTLCSYFDQPHADSQALARDQIQYRTLRRRTGSLVGAVTSVIRLARLIRASRADVLLSIMTAANVIGFTASRLPGSRIPVVVTEHNMLSTALPNRIWRPRRPYLKLLRVIYGRASGRVAVSVQVARDLERTLSLKPGAVLVIPNPIDIDRIRELGQKPVVLPWPDSQGRLLVTVSALKAAKRPHLVLETLRCLPTEFRLLIVGDGPLEGDLRQRTTTAGLEERVRFLGWQDNPHAWMARCEALLLFSSYEGFGLVVAEAAALGVPAVTTVAGGLAETTRATGGYVVDSADPRDLAGAVLRALSSTNTPVVPEAFRPDRVTAAYLELLAKALG